MLVSVDSLEGKKLTSNLFALSFNSLWSKVSEAESCVASKCIPSTTNSKLMTAITELMVFAACPQSGEKEGRLSWELRPITSVSALLSNNKQRRSGQCVPSRKCTNCWERKREAQCTWLWSTAEKHPYICTVLHFITKIEKKRGFLNDFKQTE